MARKQWLPGAAMLLMAISLGVAVVMLVVVAIFGEMYRTASFEADPVVLSQGWELGSTQEFLEDGSLAAGVPGDGEQVELPVTLPGGGDWFYLSCRLSPQLMEGFSQPPSLFLREKYMDMDVLFNGELLDSYRIPDHWFGKTSGTVLRVVALPEDWENGMLCLRGKLALGDDVECSMAAPWFAPQANLFFYVIMGEIQGLISNVAIFALGLVMSLGGMLCGKTLGIRRRLVCTGIFAILFVCYDTCLTNTSHLLVDNAYLLYLLEFFSLMTVSLPLLALGRENAGEKARKLLDGVLVIASLNFLVQLVFHFTGLFELRQMLIFDHLVILLSVGALVAALLGGKKNKAQLQFLCSMIPLVVGGMVDMVRFYLNWAEPLNMAFRLGTMAFVLVQVFFAGRSYLEVYRSAVESAHFQRLAYVDSLTGIGNRAAFERDVSKMEENLSGHLPLWIVMGDVNGLKLLNDQKGHLEGDKLLKKAAAVLTTVLEDQGRGKLSLLDRGCCYRIGGDEFALLLSHREEEEVRQLVENLRKESQRVNASPPTLALSLGYADYRPEDQGSLEKVFSRADGLMYEEKQRGRTPG